MRLIALALSVLLTLGGAAVAQDNARNSWTGCYAGGHIGYSATVTETTLDVSGTTLGTLNGFGSSGAALGGTAGCDFQPAGTPFVIGVWGDYSWHDQTWDVSSPFLGGTIAKLEIEQQWSAGVRLGYLVTEKVLAYGLVGYSRVEMGDIEVPVLSTSIPVGDLDGWLVGGGVTVRLTDSIDWDLRYTLTLLDKQDVTLFGPVALGLEPEIHTVRTGISYRFNF